MLSERDPSRLDVFVMTLGHAECRAVRVSVCVLALVGGAACAVLRAGARAVWGIDTREKVLRLPVCKNRRRGPMAMRARV